MYAGKIVETGSVREVIEHPQHPYTHGLIASAPSRNPRGRPLRQIPGMTPSLLHLPSGCAFRERCERATDLCHTPPQLVRMKSAHALRCFHPVELKQEVA